MGCGDSAVNCLRYPIAHLMQRFFNIIAIIAAIVLVVFWDKLPR